MSLQYIIDGYNLLHHPQFRRNVKKTEDPRNALVALITSFALTGSLNNRVLVVFDGWCELAQSLRQGLRIRAVASGDESADAVIMRLTERTRDPKGTVVVSDDKEIRIFVKACGARAMSVADFFAPLIKEEEKAAARKGEGACELSITQMAEIDKELRKIWLK